MLLQSEQELSARQVVDLLQYFLGTVDKEIVRAYEVARRQETKSKKKYKGNENSEDLYKHGVNRFLNLILLRNIKEGKDIKSWRNDVPKLQLQSELIHLSIQQTIQLFHFLKSVISSEDDTFSGNIAEQRTKKAIDWINMLLDSHFAELILTEDSHKELEDLFQLCKNFTNSLPIMESAIGHISLLLQNPSTLERNENSDYSIEVLNL